MDWSSVIYSAIGGGGGAALGVLIAAITIKLLNKNPKDPEDKTAAGIRGGLAALGAIIGINVVPPLYKNMTLPRIIPLDYTEVFEQMPILKIIAEQSPADFKKLTRGMDRASRNKNVTQEDLNDIREVLFELMDQKVKTASADTIRSMQSISNSQYKVYRDARPEICTLIFHAKPYPDVTYLFSEEDNKTELEGMVELFSGTRRDSNFVPDLSKGETLFMETVLESIETLGVTNIQPDIIDGNPNEDEHKLICDLQVDIFTKVNDMNDEDLMHVYDFVASQ